MSGMGGKWCLGSRGWGRSTLSGMSSSSSCESSEMESMDDGRLGSFLWSSSTGCLAEAVVDGARSWAGDGVRSMCAVWTVSAICVGIDMVAVSSGCCNGILGGRVWVARGRSAFRMICGGGAWLLLCLVESKL